MTLIKTEAFNLLSESPGLNLRQVSLVLQTYLLPGLKLIKQPSGLLNNLH